MKSNKIRLFIALSLFFSIGAALCSTALSNQQNGSSDSINSAGVEVSEQTGAPVTQEATEKCLTGDIFSFVKTRVGLTILIIIFLVMLTVPFIPALKEIIKPKDRVPLAIDQDYVRDPRFLDKLLIAELKPVLDNPNYVNSTLKYKNKVPIDITSELKASDPVQPNHVIISTSNMNTSNDKVYYQPVYVQGRVNIGENCIFDVLLADGDITIGKNFRVLNWMSSYSNITVKENGYLGKKVVSEKLLQIQKNCLFSSLYAVPAATYDVDFNLEISAPATVVIKTDKDDKMTDVGDTNWYVSPKVLTIPPYSMVNNDMIIKSDLTLRRGSVVNGNLKVYGKVILEKEVRIYGDLICYGEIEVGEFCFIKENIFTQSTIILKKGVRVGLPGQHKSIIGKKGISLEKNVLVYGNIMTAGKGIVL